MSDLVSALASAAHVAGIAAVVTFSSLRLMAFRRHDIAQTRFADNGNGMAALLVYGAGLWRLFGELEKPLSFYTDNPVFWSKVALLALAGALEIYPQYVVLPWHFRHARGQPIEPAAGQFERMYACALAQLPCLVAIVFLAALMARGIGLPATEAPQSELPARATYERHCQACHQPDGRGLNGKVAASFVDDPRVLGKSDDTLLRSIEHGKVGPAGAMPAWGAVLSTEQRREVLAYIRSAYGGARLTPR